ncbi:Guanylate cyclase 32E precursor, putative [Pediculus humanus corporis]|uniref:guanylate cyclase n=1 Tax=Pediculus humanus subsp. corporis TaxID=121224 RepID=E0VPI9_PEDHC|nr:Guanylate cyclase 32E precursor, putative [Pediculus humanus corporis]EEB15295.1 Guanylate cyclase 32E precursor, putative [Pediculus humanus corporis]
MTKEIMATDAFLGPVCDYVIAPVARYSATWGIPVLTAGAQANPFRHKTFNFHTLTRMMGSYTLVGEALRHILENYGWKVAGLLYHNHGKEGPLGNSICHFTMAAVYSALNETPVHRSFNQNTFTYNQIKELLQTVAKNSRIVVVCANPHTVREILLAAEELLMVDSGEYVFFNIELLNSMNNDSYTPWFNKNDTHERNERAKKAYTALLTVTAMTPENTEYEQFSKEVKELAEKNYNYSFGDDSVSTFITAFYDAVILYSLALNESIREGGSEVNGNDITRRMWNRTFKGITGDVHIDGNGDRFADYSLLDMNPETNRFEIVANYIGATRTLQTVKGKKIHWAADREHPPPDTPKCGFDGSLCQTMPEYAILSIILSTLVVIVIIVSVILFRHYKLEAEIASMTWKISIDELVFPNEKRGQGSIILNMGRRGSQLTVVSYGGISNYEGKQIFIRRAIYKGIQVAVKDVQKTRFEFNRSLLCEFKRMKDIHHDHLVRFYGACITPSMIMFITEYCPKGSLQDILENEQFKLDWMFKFSLMQDIVRGMLYIHNSEIRSHGNLKSSNCLVDARFVLKISDFGLHSLRAPKDLDPGDHAYWKRLLWTAPELLRMEENAPPEGTQKGDVYSFGIIVHEMLTRQGPFYIDDVNMSPRIDQNKDGGREIDG